MHRDAADMRQRRVARRLTWAALLVLAGVGPRFGLAAAAELPSQDAAGSRDSAFVPRIGAARIIGYDQADDEEAVLPQGRFRDFGFVSTRRLEGRVTRIAYGFPPGISADQTLSTIAIMNHYKDVLQGEGFSIAFECAGAEGCGGFNFGEGLTQSMVEAHASEEGNLIIDFLHPVGNDIRYVLATLDRPEGRVTLALAVARHVGRPPGMFVETVEQKPDAQAPAESSATVLAAALRIQGRVALYGIHFASEKATIRPNSRPLLEQVSRMLLADPAMRLIVVGHSDASGALAHALELSAARAQAVVQALETDWKVPAAQLTSLGVGPAAPIASNADDIGRGLNRRIELVAQ